MTIVERIKRLFSAPPPPTVVTEEALIGREVLDLTIKRAEKTSARVTRRSANDAIKAEQLVRATDEAAEQLRRAWGR